MRSMLVFAASIGIFAVPALALAQENQVQTTLTSTAQAPKPGTQSTMSKCDSKAPLNVSSDAFEGDFETKVGTYTGNVVVIQTVCRLRADKVNVKIVAGKPDEITADGNVVFATPSGTAVGDHGVYELEKDPPTITLTGKVVLTKEKNVMRGTLLVVDTDSGVAHLTSHGAQGGRVQSILNPSQKLDAKPKKSSGSETPPSTN
jgi:lipopolysaccharide export system protein LptA